MNVTYFILFLVFAFFSLLLIFYKQKSDEADNVNRNLQKTIGLSLTIPTLVFLVLALVKFKKFW